MLRRFHGCSQSWSRILLGALSSGKLHALLGLRSLLPLCVHVEVKTCLRTSRRCTQSASEFKLWAPPTAPSFRGVGKSVNVCSEHRLLGLHNTFFNVLAVKWRSVRAASVISFPWNSKFAQCSKKTSALHLICQNRKNKLIPKMNECALESEA